MERLQKVIAASGITSRRKAEKLMLEGRVSVDGKVIRELGYQVTGKERIEVDGEILTREEKVYFLLNKPRGVITSVTDDKNRKTVTDLIPVNERIYPVGRLDYDTTGVLLLTNDGEFANLLMHPNKEVDKVYLAKVKGIVREDTIAKLKSGVVLDNKKVRCARAKVKRTDYKNGTSFVELTIHEGINHQVKRMLNEVGFEVLKLTREQVYFFTLDGLKSGEYRPLTKKEVAKVYALEKKMTK